jgi:hypothetical protein
MKTANFACLSVLALTLAGLAGEIAGLISSLDDVHATPVTIEVADSSMSHTNRFTMNRSRIVISDNKMEFFGH